MADGKPVDLPPLYQEVAQEQRPGGAPSMGDFQKDPMTQMRAEEIIISNRWQVTSPTERTIVLDSDPQLEQLKKSAPTFEATFKWEAARYAVRVDFKPVITLRVSEKDYADKIAPRLASK